MKIALTKNEWGHFVPTYDSDKEKANKIKQGETREFTTTKPRNIRFHRKLFALFRLTIHYLPEQKREVIRNNGFTMQTEEDVLFYCKIKMGHIRNRAVTKNGNIIYQPKSISFESMGNDEFKNFYNKSVDICLDLMQADRQLIEQELMNFM